jgi:hypothetical protein
MPNWCNNSVTVTHSDPAKLQALVEAVNAGRFCDFVIPTPKDLQITSGFSGDAEEQAALELKGQSNLEEYGFRDWYDFQVSRWGTKWDVEAYDRVEFDPAGVTFGFDSAWSPPIGVYEALVEQGFSVTAFYYEPGMCFAGKWSDEDGDQYFEIGDLTAERVRELLPQDLDDVMAISENLEMWEEDQEELDNE